VRVGIYGAGQLGSNVAALLASRTSVNVVGPAGRHDAASVLSSGSDVVVIATASRLHDLVPDILRAVAAGSNVIVSGEEASFPWRVDGSLADEVDRVARAQGVTVLGCGINPGFVFDGFVVAAAGPTAAISSIRVQRVVDLSAFNAGVLRRLGLGARPEEFDAVVASGAVAGHIGFEQSIEIVARAAGLEIDSFDASIAPLFADRAYRELNLEIEPGQTAGIEQTCIGIVLGKPWFTAVFTAHVAPAAIGKPARDEYTIEGEPTINFAVEPGMQAVSGVAALIANSVHRVVQSRPGWLTVADVAPAFPRADMAISPRQPGGRLGEIVPEGA
jgi:2,4-diaminopentanoate dehydrogenase